MRRSIRAALACALLAHVACVSVDRAEAAVYTITTLAEDTITNGNCTLREALIAASGDLDQDLCDGDVGPDEIVLQAVGSYELDDGNLTSNGRSFTVRGAAGQPPSAYVVDLGGLQRFLSVGSGSHVTLENLTLFDGEGGTRGGAVLAEDSDLTLRRVVVSVSAADNGGGISFRTNTGRHLDIEGSTFSANQAVGDQAFGGGVEVSFQGAGSVRIVDTELLGNQIVSAAGNFSRTGAGVDIQSFGGTSIELRHLSIQDNDISAPSGAMGAGISIVGNLAEGLLLEDAAIVGNDFLVASGSNEAAGLRLDVTAPSASLRRLRILDNDSGPGRSQVLVQASGESEVILSDILVANGAANGIYLTTGGPDCSLVAGNLTVTGHPQSGMILQEADCPLRIENSIAFGNATSSGSNVNIFVGDPEVSPETLVGVDPQFVDPLNGDFRLGPTSVAAEAGDAAFVSVGPFDAAHGARIAGAELDLGAYERGSIFAHDFERGDLLPWSAAVP